MITRFEDAEGFEIVIYKVEVDEVLSSHDNDNYYYVRGIVEADLGSGFEEYDIAFAVGIPPWRERKIEAWFVDSSDHRSLGFDREGVEALEDHLNQPGEAPRLFDGARDLAGEDED